MTERIYKEFNVHSARQLVESVTEAANTMYYVFSTKHRDFSGSTTPTPSASITNSVYQSYDEMIFGKLLTSNDISIAIENKSWANGTTYYPYDDQDTTMLDKDYYAVTSEGTDYHVWKVIDNNGNTASNSQPLYSDVSSSLGSLYIKSATDGYQWRFMYTIPQSKYTKFNANNYIPVVDHANASGNAINGALDAFVVTNSGNNYNEFANGSVVTGTNSTVFTVNSTSFTLNSANDFYNNCSIYFTSGLNIQGTYRKITDWDATSNTITVGTAISNTSNTDQEVTPDSTCGFEITPTLTIKGDGSNASARPIINQSTNTIANVEVLSRGEGYTYANITIEANNMATANLAAARAVIGPFGGHAADPKSELEARYVIISTDFANNEADNIQTDNDFRTVGLLKDPFYANVEITIDSPTTNFSVTETLNHNTSGGQGVISFANSTILRLSNAYGMFNPGANVTGVTSSATANVVSMKVNAQDTRSNTHFFQQTVKFNHVMVTSNNFVEDEKVTEATTDANGFVYASNSSVTQLSEVRGTFDATNNYIVTGGTSSETARFSNTIQPDLVRGSGEVLLLKNVEAISRSNTNTETIKLVIKF